MVKYKWTVEPNINSDGGVLRRNKNFTGVVPPLQNGLNLLEQGKDDGIPSHTILGSG